ncbi:TPA: hypothetical protein ACSTLU_004338 [Serratia fonticola]
MKITVETTAVRDLVQITAEGFAGKIFRFPRHQLSLIKKSGLIDSSGHIVCYVLYNDHFDKQTFGNNVYIGETSNGLSRIENHDKGRNDWNQAIVISPDDFDMDSIYRLEGDLIKRIQWSMKFKAENIKQEDRGVLCSCQIAAYEGFIEKLYKILEALRFDVFTLNTNGLLNFKDHENCFARILAISPPTIEILEGSMMLYRNGIFHKKEFEERGIQLEERPNGLSFRGGVNYSDFYIFNKNETFILGGDMVKNFERNFVNINGIPLGKLIAELEKEYTEAE